MFDDSQENVVRKPMPPLERACAKRLETPEEIARALRLAPPRKNSALQSMVVALEVSVIVCIVLAAIVWWRLLT